jgi:hypothetical protein
MTRRPARTIGSALGIALAAMAMTGSAAPAQTAAVVTLCDRDDQAGAGVNLVTALATATDISFDCPAGSQLLWTATRELGGNGVATQVKIDGSNQGRPLTLVYGIPPTGDLLLSMIELYPGSGLDLIDVAMDGGPDLDYISMGVGSQGTLRISGGRYTGFRGAVDATRGELRVIGARFERNGSAVDIGDQTNIGLVSGSRFVDNYFGVSVTPGVPGLEYPQGPVYAVEGSLLEGNEIALSHCFEAACPDDASLSVANTVISHSTAGNTAVRGRSIRFVNDTFTDNQGDGLTVIGSGALSLENTILAGGQGVRCIGNITDLGHNIQAPSSSCGATIQVADPALSPLLEPTPGGPALGLGDPAACGAFPVNKRDFYRKPRLVSGTCSIGAVEGPISTPVLPPTTAPG